MKKNSVLRVTMAAIMCVGLLGVTACASESSKAETEETIGGQVITPITMDVTELPGKNIELMVGQVLNVNTGDVAPESFVGESSDPIVAEFQTGKDDGSAVFNPGVTGLSKGTATVKMESTDEADSEVEFTVTVIAASAK